MHNDKTNPGIGMNYSERKLQNSLLLLSLIISMVSISASQIVNYPGAGVFRAGKLWDSFLTPNVAPYYRETGSYLRKTLMRIGNFDRAWSTPTHMWPGGWEVGPFWQKGMYMTEFNPDSTWNPPTLYGVPNPSYYSNAGGSYAFASFRESVLGANDPSRNYEFETRWVDSLSRHQALYETGFPTTIGVDVRLKIRQFTLNWNNFEDFIVVEMKLINTGAIDMNADGIPERTDNVIRALTLLLHGEFMCSYRISRTGGRANRFGATRGFGYVGDNDPLGRPWDIIMAFPGESTDGARDMGLNDWPSKAYGDVWSGWSWLAAKQGGRDDSIVTLPDKNTLYGTNAIGLELQRGWFTSAGHGRGLGVTEDASNPKIIHTAAMGTWFIDGGKSRDAALLDLRPDSNFFAGGITGDPTTFVQRQSPSRPTGDRKLFSDESSLAFEANTWEPDWTRGFTGVEDFLGDMYSGIGPLNLAVAETVTVIWVEAAGYKFRGLANAIAAARWAYEHDFQLPEIPPVPDLQVIPSPPSAAKIYWNNAAESHPAFAGYKIYRASSDDSIAWLQGGMRGMDRYWMNNLPGPTPDSLLQPVNPEFIGQTLNGVPNSWGPYVLISRIPEQNLPAFGDSSLSGFTYSYIDSSIHPGIPTWYYVAAYTDQYHDLGPSYSGYNPPTTNSLETSNLNRNGASGLWLRTYPFADLSPYFPTSPEELKQIGAAIQVGTTGVSDAGIIPLENSLEQNYPNPFNPSTTFKLQLASATYVMLKVYDVLGRETATLINEPKQAGTYTVNWDASNLAGGVYFFRLQAEGFVATRKLLLLK